MKTHWEVLYEMYREAVDRQGQSHNDAMAFAVAQWANDLHSRKPRPTIPGRSLQNVMVTLDGWNAAGSRDWPALREQLRHAWTDGVLVA
jgi:hypothetical protein